MGWNITSDPILFILFFFLLTSQFLGRQKKPESTSHKQNQISLQSRSNINKSSKSLSVGQVKVQVKVTQSCPTLCDPMNYIYSYWNSPGQNTGVGSLSLLQEIFPTQGSNPGLKHCRQILYQLSHKGSPRMLEWVAYLVSRYFPPRNPT